MADEAILVAQGGLNDGELVPLGHIKMGRLSDNDVVVREKGVSRIHAEIVETDTEYRLRDLSSTNGTFVESPSSDVLDRTAYARYGSAASANMFCRALSNNSYEGWSRDSRMISLLACRITRPGRAISAKRTALSRLLTHCPPNTRRFIAELKLNASTAMAHHAALAPNSLDGSLPPARSLLRTLWTSSPLPHLCLDHQTARRSSVTTC